MPISLTTLPAWLVDLWPHVTAAVILAITISASVHALLVKRDTRSAIGWVGLIWLSPVFGAFLYWIFGVNRIHSRASQLKADAVKVSKELVSVAPDETRLADAIGPPAAPMRSLEALVRRITQQTLVDDNRITPLDGGDAAYPVMLEAIATAQRSVALSSYIFDRDPTGKMFVDALAAASRRGVEVRVLIDGIGVSYSLPSILTLLERAGVRSELFLPTSVPIYFPYANLRNHRKILVVDGRVGFTGGLNIRHSCRLSENPRHPVRDLHFRIEGPVTAQLLQVFVEDWAFATEEQLTGPTWDADLSPATNGDAGILARGIRYGPDDPDVGRIRLVLAGALAAAQRSVRVMTPYFLPDDAVCQALDVAAMRGVEVDIVLPGENNLTMVNWASTAMLWQVLERGCRVWKTPPPFDHSKLMVVDRTWTLLGSGNWDERSMRLNFEFNVECYDRHLAAGLDDMIVERIAQSRRVSLAEVDGRRLPVRLRDGIARLFSPYL
jgi:cardiolipin synthase